ncbi:hypothetical protein [Spirilliplanes yamanashiensis]|uniref:Uncharacterized protein n=1 Tax=Spirilliplanes yamanashiensis TaxID=42233 RepID=A0A8J4DKC2_9ACTN|nr:hypothetical protein [Spirilliplanes yamanashiensis]MDP9817927.1 hypothetical protein [Spirilliplanes yamanashiensis]GIJ04736.1 hypothetical protein Sya03_40880 [Spirilliplanes yamanashiensis]
MRAEGAVDLLIPAGALPGLTVPALAVTDGTADPEWVDTPCAGPYIYSREATLRLPYDAATAAVVRRRLRHDRRVRLLWFPLSTAPPLAASVLMVTTDGHHLLRLLLVLAAAGVSLWMSRRSERLTVTQQPERVGRLGVHLPAVAAPAAREWLARNPAVRVVTERPVWRRYSPPVYRWSAAACAATGLGVWWAGLRGDEFSLLTVAAFVALLAGAVVLAVKSLPPGTVRFDDPA